MEKLTDDQLMILDNLIYLREIANGSDEFKTVDEFINYISDNDGMGGRIINQNKIYEAEKVAKVSTLKAAGEFEAANKVSNINQKEFIDEYIEDTGMASYQKAVDLVNSQGDTLKNLEIVYTSGDYKKKLMSQGADQYCMDGITAVCFKDNAGNAYVIYRGTDGHIAWSENIEAAFLADTQYQEKALSFFESIPDLANYNDVQLSGHSKGGNMVQYVTIVSQYSKYIVTIQSSKASSP